MGAALQEPGEILRPPAIMPSILLDERRLSYVSMGHSRSVKTSPVVFVHGFGGFFMDWARIMTHVQRHTSCYALDLPGWGFSEANFQATGIEDDAEAVTAFIERLGLDNVILCGISYGAGVSWAMAARQLPRVRHVILLNPMPPWPLKWIHSALYQGIFRLNQSRSGAVWGHRFLTRQMYELICRETLLGSSLPDEFYLRLGYRAIKQPAVAFIMNGHAKAANNLDWSMWERSLASVNTPVTIMQSFEDRVFSPESARYLQSLIPGSELIEVAQSGHAMVFDQYRKVYEVILSLLEAADSGRSGSGDEFLQENLRRRQG